VSCKRRVGGGSERREGGRKKGRERCLITLKQSARMLWANPREANEPKYGR